MNKNLYTDTEIKRTVTVDHIEFVEGISNLDSNNASIMTWQLVETVKILILLLQVIANIMLL